jgi:cyclophilin family peptidyl-prolyl cis-trans isomerase
VEDWIIEDVIAYDFNTIIDWKPKTEREREDKMPKTKRTIRSNRRAAKTQRNNRLWIGIALAVLIVFVAVVLVTSEPEPEPTASEAPVLVSEYEYSGPPPMLIDTSKQYTATVKMEKGGEIVINLYADKAPITVNSFVFLAREGYFDGVTFHRVLEGFMAQGGDPTGTGGGGPGYQFVNEDSDLRFDKAGVVAMANAGRDTNGSQFFITFGATPQLDGGYTIFGQVTSGMDVVNNLRRRDPNQRPDYTGDVIESITIQEE